MRIVALVAVLLAAWPGLLRADEGCRKLVYSANPNYPPFHWSDNGRLLGATVEITERILTELRIPGEARYVGPWNRVLKAAELGEIDLVLALRRTPDREKFLQFGEAPFSANPSAIFVRRDRRIAYRRWEDLQPYRGGASLGDRFGEGFDEFMRHHLTIVPAYNLDRGFHDLDRGLTDYFVTGYQAGMAYVLGKNMEKRLMALQPMVSQGEIHFGFSRHSPCRVLAARFDEKLRQYEREGRTEAILEKYLERWRDSAADRVE
ncbi:substrate-binding periplasmic protein [Chitinimonas lacunae]|uniref:Substrate-binding periplasmic protein n=1 Tax=Chitinimonas lacunae TaxID=1963018 RepID=A0ABV8MUL3_9NEIS